MPTLEIKLTVPEGTKVTIVGADGATVLSDGGADDGDAIERYWRDYLSPNARKVYWAAARIERFNGADSVYTLEDIAQNISQDIESVQYETVRSRHRTSGRTAKRWREENGTEEPIRLIEASYDWDEASQGMRSRYKLPPGVASAIEAVASSMGLYEPIQA
jgi:hypothetical protein